MTRIDLATLLSDAPAADRPRLEKALGRLGDSLEGAVRSFVHDKARAVAGSEAFENIWKQVNRQAHSSLDKALTGSGGGAVKLEGDTVTLDLAPLVDRVKERLVDEGMTVAGKIPEVHTDFTLVRSDDIGKAKTYVRLLQLAGNWLPVIALILVAAGVLFSVRKRRTLVTAALAVAVATGLLGIGLRVFRVLYLDRLPANVSQDAAGAVYDTMTHFLFTMVRMVVALGVVIALATWLTGGGRRAGLVRGLWTSGIAAVRTTADHAGMRLGPVAPFVSRYRTWITWVLVAAALLVRLLWSYPTGWAVVGIASCLLLLLAVVEFLGGERHDVFPATASDRLLLNGFTAQVWTLPGTTTDQVLARTAGEYRGRPGDPAVALVLGAGNVPAITPLDILHKLYAQGQVVIAKMNPVNAYLRPHFEQVFTEFVERGWVRFVDGGGAEGAYLTTHKGVDSIHVTGSDRTHDAIVWGTDEKAEDRRCADTPLNDKPFTSELGGVSPCIVTPGPWSAADFRFQAEHIVTSKMNNSGHNCVASQILIVPRHWDGTERLLTEIRRVLGELPPRADYYPGADERLTAVTQDHPEAEVHGDDCRLLVPDITDPDDPMLLVEVSTTASTWARRTGSTTACAALTTTWSWLPTPTPICTPRRCATSSPGCRARRATRPSQAARG